MFDIPCLPKHDRDKFFHFKRVARPPKNKFAILAHCFLQGDAIFILNIFVRRTTYCPLLAGGTFSTSMKQLYNFTLLVVTFDFSFETETIVCFASFDTWSRTI